MARVTMVDLVDGKPALSLGDIEPGTPGPGEVRYRVHAIGLNRADLLYLEGEHYVPTRYPSRIGVEACGVVDQVGAGVTQFAVGDRVSAIPYADPNYAIGGEFGITPVGYLAPWPDRVPAEQACAFWMMYGTAYVPYRVHTRLSPDDTVLVTAASSSAGLGGVHLAKLMGAQVIATTRTGDKKALLLEQGADHVIATDEEPLARRMLDITDGRGVQLAYDPIAGSFIRTYLDGLADGAKVFVYGMLGGDPSIEYPIASVLRRGLSIQPYSAIPALADPRVREETKLFLTLAFEAGRLAPVVDRVFPLEEFQAAYDHMRSGTQFGKIVMKTRFAD